MHWHFPQKIPSLILAALSIAGCAHSPHLYQGPPKSLAEVARVSLMGYQRNAGVAIRKIDGESWEYGPVVYLLPGTHTFELSVNTYETFTAGMITWQGAVLTVAGQLKAGHAYLPETEIVNGKAYVRIVDAGADFPDACMPGRVAINNSQALFASLHKDGSTCDRPIPSMKNVH